MNINIQQSEATVTGFFLVTLSCGDFTSSSLFLLQVLKNSPYRDALGVLCCHFLVEIHKLRLEKTQYTSCLDASIKSFNYKARATPLQHAQHTWLIKVLRQDNPQALMPGQSLQFEFGC